MSNVHYDLFCLAEFPTDKTHSMYLTGLDRQLLGHMCTRYNDKATPPKAWPGQDELMRITGCEPESNSRAISRLVDLTFLFRITRPSKGTGKTRGNRSEVAPNLKLIASYVYITDELSIKSKAVQNLYKQLTGETGTDNTGEVISNTGEVITYPTSYAKPIEPIKPIFKRIEPNYVNRINYERWNVVISDLPENAKRFIRPGRNYETLLDRCIANGMQPSEIRKAVGAVDYGNAYKVGGLLDDVLKGLAGVKRKGKSKSALDHCGDAFCDPDTRTFPEPSQINGRMDNRCVKCNDELINEIKRRNDPLPFDVGNFGRSLDDLDD